VVIATPCVLFLQHFKGAAREIPGRQALAFFDRNADVCWLVVKPTDFYNNFATEAALIF